MINQNFLNSKCKQRVVIPFRFSYEDNYSRSWNSEKVEQGLFKRYFIELPAGQTGMNVKLAASKNEYARGRYYLLIRMEKA